MTMLRAQCPHCGAGIAITVAVVGATPTMEAERYPARRPAPPVHQEGPVTGFIDGPGVHTYGTVPLTGQARQLVRAAQQRGADPALDDIDPFEEAPRPATAAQKSYAHDLAAGDADAMASVAGVLATPGGPSSEELSDLITWLRDRKKARNG